MIEALKRRKLGEIKDKEDLLTSTLFGLIRYDKSNILIKKFLEKSELLDSPNDKLKLNDFDEIKYYFWPNFIDKNDGNKIKEPDLILIFKNNRDPDKNFLLLIEAKNWSGTSEQQLPSYYQSLFNLESYEDFNEISNFNNKKMAMIYLTRFDYEEDIKNCKNHLKEKYNINVPLYGLKWIELKKICKENKVYPLTEDLDKFLSCFNFKKFEGWDNLKTKVDFKKLKEFQYIFYLKNYFEYIISQDIHRLLNKTTKVVFYGK